MFDIAKFDTRTLSEKGTDMQVLIPKPPYGPFIDPETNKPLTITLRGRNSAAFKNVQREINARQADMERRGIVRSDEDMVNDTRDLLIAVTMGWSFDMLDGQPFLFSADNVNKMWSDERWPWLRTQASNFIATEGNFLAL